MGRGSEEGAAVEHLAEGSAGANVAGENLLEFGDGAEVAGGDDEVVHVAGLRLFFEVAEPAVCEAPEGLLALLLAVGGDAHGAGKAVNERELPGFEIAAEERPVALEHVEDGVDEPPGKGVGHARGVVGGEKGEEALEVGKEGVLLEENHRRYASVFHQTSVFVEGAVEPMKPGVLPVVGGFIAQGKQGVDGGGEGPGGGGILLPGEFVEKEGEFDRVGIGHEAVGRVGEPHVKTLKGGGAGGGRDRIGLTVDVKESGGFVLGAAEFVDPCFARAAVAGEGSEDVLQVYGGGGGEEVLFAAGGARVGAGITETAGG